MAIPEKYFPVIASYLSESNAIENIRTFTKDFEFALRGEHVINTAVIDSVGAFKYIWMLYESNVGLSVNRLLELHRIAMAHSDSLYSHQKGAFRLINVTVAGDFTPKPEYVPLMIDAFIESFNKKNCDALELHYEFEHIHPFVDGNGRVGRLLYALDLMYRGGELSPFLGNFFTCGDSFKTCKDKYFDNISNYRQRRLSNGQEADKIDKGETSYI
jgi:Fic family protein